MAMGIHEYDHPLHQPTETHPPMAWLAAWNEVNPGQPNTFDAAIADTLDGPYHTIANQILNIGGISDHPIDADVGINVMKAGRTTGVTYGRCTATGAAVNVSYGEFTATFVDQDVFEGDDQTFSAPGDSGSLIIGATCKCPCSLLFAGNATTTIGNPLHYVIEAFNIQFPFA